MKRCLLVCLCLVAIFGACLGADSQNSTVKCLDCGTMNTPDTVYCSNCGKKVTQDIPKQIICPHCGGKIPGGTIYCPLCGEKSIIEKIKCPKCGTINTPENKFCATCGKPLANSVSSPDQKPNIKTKQNQTTGLDLSNRFGVGINYPGIDLRYISNVLIYEARYQSVATAQSFGLRIYKPVGVRKIDEIKKSPIVYYGFEAATIMSSVLSGTNILSGGFLGIEIMFNNHFGLMLDGGLYYVGLNSSAGSMSDIGFVVSSGLTYYFDKAKQR